MAADVGLRVDIGARKVLCCVCHRYLDPRHLEAISVLPDVEALAHVCQDCCEMRKGELPSLLEEWCRGARPVVPPNPKPAD